MFLPSNITLQFGDTGDFVAELQRRLSLINLFNETLINATYDSNTVNAVKSFQSMQGLRVDGVAGPETLRRLNGVISGDSSTSSSGNKEEDEKKERDAALMVDAVFADIYPNQAIDPTLSAAPPAKEEKHEAAVEKPVVAAPPPRSDMAAPPQESQQQQMDALKQQEIARQQQAQQPTAEELQARLQQQQAEMQKLQEQIKQQTPVNKPAEPPKPAAPPQPKEEPAPERRSLGGMLQKLVDYIESKLPRSVSDEVKAIGQTLVRAGVREAPIPGEAGPATPAIEAGRGQQQQQQRG